MTNVVKEFVVAFGIVESSQPLDLGEVLLPFLGEIVVDDLSKLARIRRRYGNGVISDDAKNIPLVLGWHTSTPPSAQSETR